MIEPVRNAWATTTHDEQRAYAPVSYERMSRFSSAMIAAGLRAPMIDLTAANGGSEERDHEALVLPIRPPVITAK